jgi:RimJ/RimL family protein N-acetyltransferase
MDPIELDAGSVRLRPWRDDDVDAVWAAQSDPQIRLWAGGDGIASRDDAMALLRRLTGQENQVSWAVVDAGTGALLGSLSVYRIDEAQAGAQIGYWTTPAARGRGVAAVAVDTAARWVFGTLAVDRIELCHAVENVASGRVAEKAGFTLEARLRRSHHYGDGVKHDELLWARLADDPVPAGLRTS